MYFMCPVHMEGHQISLTCCKGVFPLPIALKHSFRLRVCMETIHKETSKETPTSALLTAKPPLACFQKTGSSRQAGIEALIGTEVSSLGPSCSLCYAYSKKSSKLMLVCVFLFLLIPYDFSAPTALFNPWLSQSLKTWTTLRVS